MAFTPIPFDPVHDAAVLNAMGYTCQSFPAFWRDVGGPESGPKLVGGPAYDEWTLGDQFIIVCEGEVVDMGTQPEYFFGDDQF